MAINRVSGLVLPASTKYLVDNIIGKRQAHLLPLISGGGGGDGDAGHYFVRADATAFESGAER